MQEYSLKSKMNLAKAAKVVQVALPSRRYRVARKGGRLSFKFTGGPLGVKEIAAIEKALGSTIHNPMSIPWTELASAVAGSAVTYSVLEWIL